MVSNETLLNALENNREHFSSLAFSQGLYNHFQDISIVVPIDEARELYDNLSLNLTKNSQHSPFIDRGLGFINDMADKGKRAIGYAPHTLWRIRDIYDAIQFDIPEWVPEVFVVENDPASSSYRNTYLFNWFTCDMKHIPNNFAEAFYSYLVDHSTAQLQPENTVQATNCVESKPEVGIVESVATNQSTKNVIDIVPNKINDINTNLSEVVVHSVFAAKKYLSLVENATKRNLEFNISVEDFSALLRKNRCHFTGEELVHFPHKRSDIDSKQVEIPSNYLTIDRLDSDKGYVLSNVVLCGHALNQLKSRMSNAEFEKAMSIKKLLRDFNMSEEQMAILGIAI
jgi:hypothetical protein